MKMQITDYGPRQTYYPYEQQDSTVERKPVYRDPGVSQERRTVEICEPRRERRESSPREHRRSSRSADPPPREMVLSQKGRRRRNSIEPDYETDYETDSSSPRRIRNRRHYDRRLPVAHANPVYASPPHHSHSIGAPQSSSQGPPGPPRRYYDSDSDSSSSGDESGKKAQPKPPPKQILYTGLACVATLAAANGIYQSAKAHHARQREIEEGEISTAEAQRLKAEARKMDLIALGIAAVGAYNVRNGWKRAEGHWKAHRERQAEERR